MIADPTTSPALAGEFKHFKTAVLHDGILLAGFDYFGKSVNVLNVESMSEWQKIVQFAGAILCGQRCGAGELEGRKFLCRSRSGADARRATATLLSGDGATRESLLTGSLTRWTIAKTVCRRSGRRLSGRWTRAGTGMPHAHCQHPSEDLFCSAGSQAGHSSWVRRHSTSPDG